MCARVICVCLDTSVGPEPSYRAVQMSGSVRARERVCLLLGVTGSSSRFSHHRPSQTCAPADWGLNGFFLLAYSGTALLTLDGVGFKYSTASTNPLPSAPPSALSTGEPAPCSVAPFQACHA